MEFRLTHRERKKLRDFVNQVPTANDRLPRRVQLLGKSEKRRAQALLQLSSGNSIDEVALVFQVSSWTISRWIKCFQNRPRRKIRLGLKDDPNIGYPRTRTV